MKAVLTYYQATKNNWWHFYFADCFNGEQLTKAFLTKEEANQYASNKGIEYNDNEMISVIT